MVRENGIQINDNSTLLIRLKELFDKKPDGTPEKSEDPAAVELADDGTFLLCANCLHLITFHQANIAVNGSHEHTFANPSGLVYTIGCFNQAPGCATVGEATAEFSWFQGYRWRVAVCAACLSHLGWRFSSSGSSFFGLILNRLVNENNLAGNA